MPPDTGAVTGPARFASAVAAIADSLRLDATAAHPIRVHDAAIYLLPRERIVVRMAPATPENRQRADLAARLTSWLVEQHFPAVAPAHHAAVQAGDVVATLWRYLPEPPTTAQPEPPTTAQPEPSPAVPPERATSVARSPASVRASALGHLLRDLHALPATPFRLPDLDPFARLRAAIRIDDERDTPALSPADRSYLTRRADTLDTAYRSLDFPLGRGLIHNDAHLGNLLPDTGSPYGHVLIDWESARRGPREVDLVVEGAPGNRFHESTELRQALCAAYGHDIAQWNGWQVLRDARDLHSVAAYIRTAATKPAALDELRRRLTSLRTNDRSVPWRALR